MKIDKQLEEMAVDMVGKIISSIENIIKDEEIDAEEAIEKWIAEMGTEVYDLVVPILKEHYKLKTLKGFR